MVPIASCPATKENVFWSMGNQPTRWRTLVRVATSSRSFFAIKYANELPNRTATSGRRIAGCGDYRAFFVGQRVANFVTNPDAHAALLQLAQVALGAEAWQQ